jgi:cell division protein FtsB
MDYWLADGFHRVAAWSSIGRVEVPAEIRQGDRRRAILHSVAANSAHGLRRTNADKRRAVTTLLEDEEWGQWSNREIARRCAVSDPFVAKMREELSANGLQIATERQVERGGSTYTQNTANIGADKHPAERTDAREGGDAETSGGDVAANAPAPEQPAHDPHREGLAELSREGLEDDVAGLRAENDELRAELERVKAERDALKTQVDILTSGNQGATISRLHKQVSSLKGARDDALEKAAKETRRANFIAKERDALRKSLEVQEIEI